MAEPQIISDPRIMMGKPVIRGTRITIEYLLRLAASGLTVSDIVEEHPRLIAEDVQAAYSFAAELVRGSQPDAIGSWQSDSPEWTTIELSN